MSAYPKVKAQLVFTGISGLIGVMAGAVGAHALKGRVAEDRQAIFGTAAHYQVMHSAVLAAIVGMKVALLSTTLTSRGTSAVKCLDTAFVLIAAGIIGFSGQIYSKVLGGPKALSPVTPLGGMCLMAGWGALAATAFYL